MTTGKRFAQRTKYQGHQRVLDARTKAVLNTLATERPGTAIAAYLRAFGTK